MSQSVRILPEQLANKIAAGEVVDRPASVVKELVENSLDAGATEVIVEIEDGGRRLVKVTDNGCGMSREDALVSLERHATSKISTDADLFSIASLGFRGEAIPSIASVSRFTLATREYAAIEGTEIYLEGGIVREVKSCGMAAGTTITVRNLFFNTPARLKFMKSRETETGHIGDILNRLALARPDVRFIASFDGKNVMRLPAGSLLSRGTAIFGNSSAQELYSMEAELGGVALSGLIGSPALSRSTSGGIYTFLNGRFIRDRVVQHAVMQGYRGLLERGRYPLLALFISVPPDQVDVNVHPAKHEVRFREQQKVHAAIQSSLDGFLATSPWLATSQKKPVFFTQGGFPSTTRVEEVKEALLKYAVDSSQPRLNEPVVVNKQSQASPDVSSKGESLAVDGYFASLRVIGQYKAAYIICEDGEGLVIIDQHAAHERVVFEELRTCFSTKSPQVQRLLMPYTLDLQPSEGAAAAVHHDVLSRAGFELEHFGGNTWLVSSVPAVFASLPWEQSLRDILEELSSLGQSGAFDANVDEILSRIACHSVVRGEWHLSLPEISALFRRMDKTPSAANCPHGRPVIVKFSRNEIEKMFKRL